MDGRGVAAAAGAGSQFHGLPASLGPARFLGDHRGNKYCELRTPGGRIHQPDLAGWSGSKRSHPVKFLLTAYQLHPDFNRDADIAAFLACPEGRRSDPAKGSEKGGRSACRTPHDHPTPGPARGDLGAGLVGDPAGLGIFYPRAAGRHRQSRCQPESGQGSLVFHGHSGTAAALSPTGGSGDHTGAGAAGPAAAAILRCEFRKRGSLFSLIPRPLPEPLGLWVRHTHHAGLGSVG